MRYRLLRGILVGQTIAHRGLERPPKLSVGGSAKAQHNPPAFVFQACLAKPLRGV